MPSEAPKAAMRAERRGWVGLGGRALYLGQTWEVAAWEIAHLGSNRLGKYPWEVVTWKKSFGKVPNIVLSTFPSPFYPPMSFILFPDLSTFTCPFYLPQLFLPSSVLFTFPRSFYLPQTFLHSPVLFTFPRLF